MADQQDSRSTEMTVEVAYAGSHRQRIISLQVRAGMCARDAVKQSGMATEFPDIDPEHCPLGVFGECVDDDYELKDGDRVEIYRPLRVGPREARRERAEALKNSSSGKT